MLLRLLMGRFNKGYSNLMQQPLFKQRMNYYSIFGLNKKNLSLPVRCLEFFIIFYGILKAKLYPRV